MAEITKKKQIFRFFGSYSYQSSLWHLEQDEIAHMSKVLKHKTGDVIELCNGTGLVSTVVLKSIEPFAYELETTYHYAKKRCEICLVVEEDLSKDISFLVPLLTELAVNRLYFTVPSKKNVTKHFTDRVFKLSVSSLKQTKCPHMLRTHIFKGSDEYTDYICNIKDHSSKVVVLDINARRRLTDILSKFYEKRTDDVAYDRAFSRYFFCIGGKSGFSDKTRKKLADFDQASMSEQILKVNTAILSTAVLAAHVFKENEKDNILSMSSV